jgi:hypothetical protein
MMALLIHAQEILFKNGRVARMQVHGRHINP